MRPSLNTKQPVESPEGMVVARQIEECISRLDNGIAVLNATANDRALALAYYDRDLGITLAKLRNGVKMFIEAEPIQDPPVSTTEKLAKGIVWESRLKLEKAEASYKVAVSNADSLRAKLNGLQSIFRRLESM